MATIQDIIDNVEAETNRVDKTAMITRAVKAVILKAHALDYFPQDRVSAVITPSSPGLIVTEALPTRWRKFDIIAPLSSAGVSLKKKFTRRDPDDMMYFDGERISDHFHVVGSNVIMESEDSIVKVGWTYYTYPEVSTLSSSTWMTLRYEQELTDGALAYVYKKLGDESTARDYRDLWQGNARVGLDGHIIRMIGDNLIEDI